MTRPMPEPPECECATCDGCAEERHEGLMREGEPCPACHVHAGPSYIETKRLTDSECAAETWKAHCKLMIAEHAPFEMRMGLEPALPSVRYVYEAEIWHHFAARPHALEES